MQKNLPIYVAKFRGDRLTELGDLVAKKETSAVKHKTDGNCRFGLANNINTFLAGRLYFDKYCIVECI